MPVTLTVVNHPAENWENSKVATSEELLKESCPKQFRRCQRIIQSSFSRRALREGHISASKNGFVWAAYNAYSKHHHLTIRPEDVWFAILTQLSFFINANAEDLRSFFVSHEGQKELEVIDGGSLEYADFGALAQRMTLLIAKNVNDPELRTWVMPSFSTTTKVDEVIASVLFMGAMQKYFSYAMTLTCGIPSVTLLGEVSDWQDILARLDKLDQLGEEPRQFAEMLRPVLRHMILSFSDPTNAEVLRFWNTIATRIPVSSGTDYISGWITAFCFWDAEGKAKYRRNEVFADVLYPNVDVDEVPAGFAAVPVKIDDNGDVFQATMLAGSVGIQASTPNNQNRQEGAREVSSNPNQSESQQEPEAVVSSTCNNTIQPLSGWWIYENEAPEAAQARESEKKTIEDELRQRSSKRRANMFQESEEDRNNFWSLYERLEELESY